jgi:hypothetical protein
MCIGGAALHLAPVSRKISGMFSGIGTPTPDRVTV